VPIPNGSLSILDPRRPEIHRGHGSGRGTFTYNPRIPKIEFSLGWELEANHCASRVPAGVDQITDGSVNGDSAEYVVRPTLVKSAKYVLGLLKDLVHSPELNTDKSCGFHVHFAPKGVSLSKMRQWAVMAEWLGTRIENEAFSAVPDARQDNQYCRKIELTKRGTRFSASKYSNQRRYHWLNTVEMFRPSGIRTVEIRLLGNTHRWKYLLAWTLFSLMLGQEAWKLIHNPLEGESSVAKLKRMLEAIRTEIKPLDKRSEAIPQWVYDDLKLVGIEYTAWERPLGKLRDIEAETMGRRKMYYSDSQPTIEPERDDDESSQYCEHDNNIDDGCTTCDHENGNCNGAGDCDLCTDDAHENGDFCGYIRCRVCLENDRVPASRRAPVIPPSVTVEAVQSAVNDMVNVRIDNINVTMNNAMVYGTGITSICYDESSNVGTGVPLNVHSGNVPLLFSTVSQPNAWGGFPESIALPITDDEIVMSEDRARFYPNNGGTR
jgi:hypothetical protein